MKRDIHLQWFYPYPPKEIWECLTKPDLLKQWNGHHKTKDFKAEVGFEWMETQKPRPGWDGKMYFKVLEVIPLVKLAYSFKGGPDPDRMTLDTVVTWELVAKNNGTALHLKHTGFQGLRGAITRFIMEKGWDKHFARPLLKFLEQKHYESINL